MESKRYTIKTLPLLRMTMVELIATLLAIAVMAALGLRLLILALYHVLVEFPLQLFEKWK